LIKADFQIKPMIQGLLAKGGLTVMASEGGVAKTSLCYQLGAAVLTGGLFAGKLQANQGSVLFIQKDENIANAKQKAMKMDLMKTVPDHLKGSMTWRFNWNPGQMPELRQWIKEAGASLVCMDSLGTLFGGAGKSLNDPETVLYLYQLDKMAAELGVAMVLVHHTKKQQKDGKKKEGERKRVRAGDLFGSSYIHNAASDVWGLVIDGGTPEEPKFVIEVIKDRMGVTQKGDRFEMLGNLEDLSFSFSTFNLSNSTELLTGSARDKALKVLKGRRYEVALDMANLASAAGIDPKTCDRVLRQIYADRANTHIDREKQPSQEAGRPRYVYWDAE
jgi:hypothetical protein